MVVISYKNKERQSENINYFCCVHLDDVDFQHGRHFSSTTLIPRHCFGSEIFLDCNKIRTTTFFLCLMFPRKVKLKILIIPISLWNAHALTSFCHQFFVVAEFNFTAFPWNALLEPTEDEKRRRRVPGKPNFHFRLKHKAASRRLQFLHNFPYRFRFGGYGTTVGN